MLYLEFTRKGFTVIYWLIYIDLRLQGRGLSPPEVFVISFYAVPI